MFSGSLCLAPSPHRPVTNLGPLRPAHFSHGRTVIICAGYRMASRCLAPLFGLWPGLVGNPILTAFADVLALDGHTRIDELAAKHRALGYDRRRIMLRRVEGEIA